MGLDDQFWDDAEAPDPPTVWSGEDQVTVFGNLLVKVFPNGIFKLSEGRGTRRTVTMQMGDHRIEIIGSIKPGGDGDLVWTGYWRQNIAVAFSRNTPQAKRRGASIEKATRLFKSDQGAIGWLSWVHRNICKVAVETIRASTHPDNFMMESTQAFRAAYDLHLINAKWLDVEDLLLLQKIPWKRSTRKGAPRAGCAFFRDAERLGVFGVGKVNSKWRYRAKMNIGPISPLFSSSGGGDTSSLEFDQEATMAECWTINEAIKRAEKAYAHMIFDWLTRYCTNSGLRTN